ncbi:MAG: tetratricopeptide repeat protein [Spirochaetia bacterium]
MGFTGYNNPGNTSKRLVICILLLLLCQTLFGQEEVRLQVTPDAIDSGQRMTFTIIIPREYTRDVDVEAPNLPSSMYYITGPYIRPYETQPIEEDEDIRDAEDRESLPEEIIRITFTAAGRYPGRFVIDPFVIQVEDETFQTLPKLVSLTNPATGLVPFDAVWQTDDRSVYVGQSVPVFLQMLKHEEIVFPEQISVTNPRGAIFEEAEGLGSINEREVGEDIIYDVPATAYIFTPTQTGTITLPRARVTAGGSSAFAPRITFTVSPLPEGIRDTGSIGVFQIRSWIENDSIQQNEAVILHIRIEGEGNLNNLSIPIPESEHFELTGREETSDISPSLNGYSGFREITCRYSPIESGTFVLETPSISWLNTETNTVETARSQAFAVQVTPQETSVEDDEPFTFSLIPPEELQNLHASRLYESPIMLLLLLPGPLLLLGIVIYRRIRFGKIFAVSFLFLIASASPISVDQISDIQSEILDNPEALSEYRLLLEEYPDYSGIWYNLSIAEFTQEEYGQAVHHLRSAISLSPMNMEYRRALTQMEEIIGLNEQVPPQAAVNPDIFFIALLVFVNLSALFTVIILHKTKGWIIILLVLSLLICIGSATGLFYTLSIQSVEYAVIASDDCILKKIPVEIAGDWHRLQEGTAVRVIAETPSYHLIRTSYGIEGWTETGNLLFEGEYEQQPE